MPVGKNKIMVVDDQHWVRTMLQEVLDYSGYTALSASGGVEALELAKKEKPDIALVDMNLPDIDGINLIIQLKKQNFKLITIAMSGSSERNAIKNAINTGAIGFLVKPFDVFELTTMLEEFFLSYPASEGEEYKWQMQSKNKSLSTILF